MKLLDLCSGIGGFSLAARLRDLAAMIRRSIADESATARSDRERQRDAEAEKKQAIAGLLSPPGGEMAA